MLLKVLIYVRRKKKKDECWYVLLYYLEDIMGSILWGLKRDDKEMMDVFFLILGIFSKKMFFI